jgi:LysR family transcriptional regulator, nitrogen assimilation regulatory protein
VAETGLSFRPPPQPVARHRGGWIGSLALDIRSLRFFVQIAELGSLGLAARSLNIAQPALSQRLANLEDHLGAQLLLRSSKGVELTDDGRRLLDHAREILQRVREIEEDVGRHAQSLHGSISVGMPAPVSNFLVVPLFRAVRESEPGIVLRIEEARTANLLDELLSGQLDIAITATASSNNRVEAELLGEERLCLVGAAGVLPEEVRFRDLFGKQLIVSSQARDQRNFLMRQADEQGGELDVVLESTSLATTKRLIAQGDLFGIMVASAAAEDEAKGRLSVARIVEPEMQRPLHMCRLKDRQHSRSATYVADQIRRIAGELRAGGLLQ